MIKEDLKFCKENIINFESVTHGFIRNIPIDILNEYQRIYKTYLDSNFILTIWCGECVFDMLKRLKAYYETQPVSKKGRPKK